MNTFPGCTAPFTALMITPEKKIRPCCKYLDDLGDLNKQSITDILTSSAVIDLQKEMYTNKLPRLCNDCELLEDINAKSIRHTFIPGGSCYFDTWKKGITMIELSSSNICNLSCAGCSTRFSSGWVKYAKAFEKNKDTAFYCDAITDSPIINADNNLLIKNLLDLDLTYLQLFKIAGGEPLLNTDMLAALRYFDEINILHKLDIVMDTSGAVIIDKNINETVTLLSKAKQVNFNISIDGPEEVQTYIRYSAKNMASLDNIRKFINTFKKNNINFKLAPTVMVYNIFSLDRLIEWWLYNYTGSDFFNFSSQVLIGPEYLTLQTLQPATISSLADYYNNIIETKEYGYLFSDIVNVLNSVEYGGHDLHNKMVKYTLDMDKIKGQSVYKAIPELTNEMCYL